MVAAQSVAGVRLRGVGVGVRFWAEAAEMGWEEAEAVVRLAFVSVVIVCERSKQAATAKPAREGLQAHLHSLD